MRKILHECRVNLHTKTVVYWVFTFILYTQISNFCFTYHDVTKTYPIETVFGGVKYFHVN